MSGALLLEHARDGARFGGKAVSLGEAMRAGLPVPSGWALDVDVVEAIARGDAEAAGAELAREVERRPFAVRSSAIGEDGARASFAGQHVTRLHVKGRASLVAAVAEIHASATSASALAYRRRLGIDAPPRMAVVVQRMVAADCAGVLFTRDPVTGADERVIEATWGLGEAVVSGLVTPDRHRARRGGEIIESVIGDKDVAIVAAPDGGTMEVPVDPTHAATACLDRARIEALEELATRCERFFDGPSDLEWAFEGARLHLLQRRPITR